MTQIASKPLPVGETGNYVISVDPEWLGAEAIVSQTITPASGMTIGPIITAVGNLIQFYATGVEVGRHEVHARWVTPTRSDCYSFFISVIEC
jgi:hypothetical protein